MVVLYAIDGSQIYQRFALVSLRSLRQHSPKIKVRVCVFGKTHRFFAQELKRLKVQLSQFDDTPSVLKSGLKWFALRTVEKEKRVLFVDADTCFWDPVEPLFRRYRAKDFYGRKEFATEGPEQRGRKKIPMRVDLKRKALIERRYKLKSRPIFSSSVMLFNHFSHKKMVQRLPLFMELFGSFHAQVLPYPCDDITMAEEVTGSLLLGHSPVLSFGLLAPNTVSHYHDWHHSGRGHLGTIMHIGHGHFLAWLKEFGYQSEYKILNRLCLGRSRSNYLQPL